jgi:accessory gene regulator protein AgrB
MLSNKYIKNKTIKIWGATLSKSVLLLISFVISWFLTKGQRKRIGIYIYIYIAFAIFSALFYFIFIPYKLQPFLTQEKKEEKKKKRQESLSFLISTPFPFF